MKNALGYSRAAYLDAGEDVYLIVARPAAIRGQKFELGRLCVTWGAAKALTEARTSVNELLERHARGDWGDVGPQDSESNNHDLEHEGRLLSAYNLSSESKVWIITDAWREQTTVLLPGEY